MEKQSMRIEDLTQTNIESEVPRQQNLREATTEVDEPVRVETAELQNDNTTEWEDLRDLIKKPVYVGIPERVLRTPQRIRAPRVGEEEPKIEEDKTKPEEKAQTKIPISRLRAVVERMQRERRLSKETEEEKRRKEISDISRRSSIPKLKDRIPVARSKSTTDDGQTVKTESEVINKTEDEAPVKTKERKPVKRERIPVMRKDYNITKKVVIAKKSVNEGEHINTSINEDQTPVKTQQEELKDEFDKLYEEIIDDDSGSLPDEILETKVKDPEKLESKFEEIVHQYNEVTAEQIKLEPVDKAKYSKIPLLRRRSSHDVKVPKQHERRLSLKTGITNKSLTLADEKTNNTNVNTKDDSHQLNDFKVNNAAEPSDAAYNENEQDHPVEINNNEDQYIAAQSPHPLPIYNTIVTPESELVKVGIFGLSTREIPLANNVNQTTNVATPEPETVKVAASHYITNKSSIDKNYDDETIVEDYATYTTATDKPDMNHTMSIKHGDIEIDRNIKVDEKVITQTLDQKEGIKTATIEYDTVYDSEENISKKNILIHNPQDELKSFSLLKNSNTVEERTRSRYIIKPVDKEKTNNANVSTLEEEVPIVKGKVSRILRRLTSNELSTNDDDCVEIIKDEIDIKTEVESIPKKSVLSKIAMFERAEPEPLNPKKQPQRYAKPQRTISEEIRHSPKIVHEVLKPNGTEQADKYTVVNVDIIQPIEIITNNEEQVTVIENIKQETIIFDDHDPTELNKTETIEIKPNGMAKIDHNETVLIDRDHYVEAKELKDAAHVYTLTDGHKTTEVNKTKPDVDRQFHNKYEISETERVNDNITTTKYTPKDLSRDYEPTFNKESNKNTFYNNKDKVQKWKSTDALTDFVPVKEKINRLKSYDENNMKKGKSTTELDFGDVFKGKVKKMIVRMNSFELLDDVKQKEVVEVINVKERPRKRSVSEKIALFERKLTPVAMEDVKVDSGRALNIDRTDTKPVKNVVNAIPDVNVTDYAAKIKELSNAKVTYGSVANVSAVELRDGRKMPVIALGTALLDPRLAKHIVSAAIDLGYRAVDTAFIYGNEKEVGEGIRAKIQDGTVRRDDLFIISKLWSTFHRPDLVETACRASLAATGLDYFDLYLIHNPMSFKEGGDPLPKIANVIQYSAFDYLDAWFAMEHLVTKGLVRSIGVSNFNAAQLARVMEKGRVKPVVNQVECHPYLSQERLSNFCDVRDVRLSCFGVLGSKGTPAEYKSSQDAAIDDPLVKVMAAGLGISPAQLLIRYQVDSGHNVVVKASSAAHLWDNLQALGPPLAPPQVTALNALNKNKRAFTFKGMGDTHRNYPFRVPF